MPINEHHIDLVIQYSLLAAGDEDDYFDRQLGPIHLIKYVYLADLFYARRNDGETYTGIDWQFYKFGPWSQIVNARVEPALVAIQANKKQFSSDYGDKDDWVRWDLRDDRLLREKEKELPVVIPMYLKKEIHKYGKDTPSLLDYVYKTKPMLASAPNERLDFSLAVDNSREDAKEPVPLRMESLSNKKKKLFKQKMSTLREMQRKHKSRPPNLINPVTNSRYDEVYSEGISWLESLSGEEFVTSEKVVEFSGDVWYSSARKGEDVS